MQIIAIKNTIFYKKFCSIRISTLQAFFHNRNELRIINASASVDVANSRIQIKSPIKPLLKIMFVIGSHLCRHFARFLSVKVYSLTRI